MRATFVLFIAITMVLPGLASVGAAGSDPTVRATVPVGTPHGPERVRSSDIAVANPAYDGVRAVRGGGFGLEPDRDRSVLLLSAEPAGLLVAIPWDREQRVDAYEGRLGPSDRLTFLLDGRTGVELRPEAGRVVRLAATPEGLVVETAAVPRPSLAGTAETLAWRDTVFRVRTLGHDGEAGLRRQSEAATGVLQVARDAAVAEGRRTASGAALLAADARSGAGHPDDASCRAALAMGARCDAIVDEVREQGYSARDRLGFTWILKPSGDMGCPSVFSHSPIPAVKERGCRAYDGIDLIPTYDAVVSTTFGLLPSDRPVWRAVDSAWERSSEVEDAVASALSRAIDAGDAGLSAATGPAAFAAGTDPAVPTPIAGPFGTASATLDEAPACVDAMGSSFRATCVDVTFAVAVPVLEAELAAVASVGPPSPEHEATSARAAEGTGADATRGSGSRVSVPSLAGALAALVSVEAGGGSGFHLAHAQAPVFDAGLAPAAARVVAIVAAVLLLPLWILFRRLRAVDLLDQPQRRALYETILSSPGLTAGALATRAGLHYTSVQHHLRILDEMGLVELRRVAGRIHCFENHGRFSRAASDLHAVLQGATARRLLAFLSAHPGATPSEAARALALRPSTVKHHMDRLAGFGLLRIEPAGGRLHLFLSSSVDIREVTGDQDSGRTP
ncbi:MAG: winged helix-turn-helix transcriptional regulator [Methanobacteriota archaeon]